MATLNDLFPGNLGRLTLLRVILRVGMPELRQIDPNKPLDPLLERRLRQAIRQVEEG